MVYVFIIYDALNISLCVHMVASCSVSEEFYADGQPMCAYRRITAGAENSNVVEAETVKAWGH